MNYKVLLRCVDADPNIFDENEYSKYNKLLINQNLINERLQNQGFQTFAQELQAPIVKALEK